MATKIKKTVKKSAFVRDILQKNPTANRQAVEEAWLAAGHDGVISSALVSGLRARMGLTGGSKSAGSNVTSESVNATSRRLKGKKRGRPAKNGVAGIKEREPRSGGQDSALSEIEVELDRLVFKLMSVGGLEEIDVELRKVRRLLYRSYSG
jgi:hypothetical protein